MKVISEHLIRILYNSKIITISRKAMSNWIKAELSYSRMLFAIRDQNTLNCAEIHARILYCIFSSKRA